MGTISKSGQGKTLYINLSIYPCGSADPTKNLTVSCPDSNTKFKTSLSDNGLEKFKREILKSYSEQVLNKNI